MAVQVLFLYILQCQVDLEKWNSKNIVAFEMEEFQVYHG